MTARDRFLLTLIVPVLVVGGVWFLLLSPQRKESGKLDASIVTAQEQLSQADSQVAQYEAARRSLRQNMEQLAQAGRAVPASAAMPALLRELERTSSRSHVDMQAITTGSSGSSGSATPSSDATGVTSMDLTLTFHGRYFDMERLFGRLDRFIRVSRAQVEATGRLLSIHGLDLTVAGGGGLTAALKASVYVLPDVRQLLPAAADTGAAAAAGAPSGGQTLPTAGVTP